MTLQFDFEASGPVRQLPDKYRPIFLGNETTRSGVNRFWHLMQHEELNRRLIWILVEVRDPKPFLGRK